MKVLAPISPGIAAAAMLGWSGQASATEVRNTCDGKTTLAAHFSLSDARTRRVGPSFDGGRHAAGGVAFWSKGRNATPPRGGIGQSCTGR